MRFLASLASFVIVCALSQPVVAHDTWLQTNSPLLRIGEVAHIDVMLGNHGNNHRDYRLASKINTFEGARTEVVAPDGSKTDLTPSLVDLGLDAKEGFWSARFEPKAPGLHAVVHSADRVRNGVRSIKSAKTYFLASESLDHPPEVDRAFAKPLGHALELTLETDPSSAGVGGELRVRLTREGKPAGGETVSFIPRSSKLAETNDPEHDIQTDAEGVATFTPRKADYLLIVAHMAAPEVSGPDYKGMKGSATLVLAIPNRPLRTKADPR